MDRRNDSSRNQHFSLLMKHFEEASIYGIDEGRISKLMLQRDGKTVFNFDRGEDIAPVDEETEIALGILLKEYN